jgi:hypothetical protein
MQLTAISLGKNKHHAFASGVRVTRIAEISPVELFIFGKFYENNIVENFVSFYVALRAPNVFILLKLSLRSYLETSCASQT